MPYDWFLKLERADAPGLFAAPEHHGRATAYLAVPRQRR